MLAFVFTCFFPPPMMGSSGSNGESVPNETMNPLFLFELIHTTGVPSLMQKNWLFFALGIPGFTLAELVDLVMSIVQGDEGEPQVLAALHMLSGCASSHTYLLFFCACAVAQLSRTIQHNENSELQILHFCGIFIVKATYFAGAAGGLAMSSRDTVLIRDSVRHCWNYSSAYLSCR